MVGGHCIGVDPYYLLHKSREVGYEPQLISIARALNEKISDHFAELVIKALKKAGKPVETASVLVLGVTFKENCPDLRNSKVLDFCDALSPRVRKLELYDPLVQHFASDYTFHNSASTLGGDADVIVVLQAHNEFQNLGSADVRELGREGALLLDFKDTFPSEELDGFL